MPPGWGPSEGRVTEAADVHRPDLLDEDWYALAVHRDLRSNRCMTIDDQFGPHFAGCCGADVVQRRFGVEGHGRDDAVLGRKVWRKCPATGRLSGETPAGQGPCLDVYPTQSPGDILAHEQTAG